MLSVWGQVCVTEEWLTFVFWSRQTEKSEIKLVGSHVHADGGTCCCCMNDDSEHGVHESRYDHLTELTERLHRLTQEIDHYAVSVPGQHHLDVWDGTACQQCRNWRHHSWWNAALIQSNLELLDDRALALVDVRSESSWHPSDEGWRGFQSVNDSNRSRHLCDHVLFFWLTDRWVHVHVHWYCRCHRNIRH